MVAGALSHLASGASRPPRAIAKHSPCPQPAEADIRPLDGNSRFDPTRTSEPHFGALHSACLKTPYTPWSAVLLGSGKKPMKRREFIALLGGAAVAWPLAAGAQQAGKLPTIGFLGAYSASVQGRWTAAFVQQLRELGWNEGRTIAIEYRWAEGSTERAAEIAAEFVRLKVNVIVLSGNALAVATKRVTATVPIVFALAGDPVGTGLVASLSRPGGNITGLSLQTTDLSGKRIELLREIVPNLRRLAILCNVGNPSAVIAMVEAQAAARTLDLDAHSAWLIPG
jgi:hypothetical protein